jgi:putative transposase
VKYGFIGTHRHEFSVRTMCRVLEVTESGYYQWLRRPESDLLRENRALLDEIRTIHKMSRGNYGSPKIHRALKRQGREVNHKRVERLMREDGLRAKRARKFKATTNSKHSLPVAENMLDRQFSVSAPNKVWAGDITYIQTDEGWLYVAVFIDLFSRMVVGWSMAKTMTADLVVNAFDMAIRRRGPTISPLIHTDRGSQYASARFREEIGRFLCEQSMSRKGNCWDNAVAESFFSALKVELVHDRRYHTRQEAKDEVFDYIEAFYNRSRIHSTTEYYSPAEFEEIFRQAA